MSATGYLAALPFPPDRFQVEAAEAIDDGHSVVVTAPTGSGKTVVAEAAIARALALGRRVLYTTPLKALSNQKFGDLRGVHGDDHVGLLTGDNSINGGAEIVVMTTEVLRNMMYADSPDLGEVAAVVLDEVHYLQDPARGPVWEEIIVHLDRAISLVCLSATVANPEELAAWVRDRRGPTSLVVETERPVPLESTYLMRDRWEGNTLRLLPVFDGSTGRANPRVVRMLRPARRRPGREGPHDPGRRYVTPRRHETAEFLRDHGMLPAIQFIFSRRGCESAAAQVVERGLRLTTRDEAAAIREEADRRTAHLTAGDLAVLGYDRFLRALEAGVAAHHAGMVPAFKETVERLFEQGLVRLVYATETLSVGINMPAKTVVLEQLSKFTGEGHELLQPGDYTQLTGRAGRRGIDERGTAVVLHTPYVPFERAAAIAAAGTHPLVSAFRPTYNMAVNLIARYRRDQAEVLLDASFAQFHERSRRHSAAASIARDEERLAAERARAECDRGDVWAAIDGPHRSRDAVMAAFAAATAAGDVLQWEERGRTRRSVVVARGHGKRPRLLTVDDEGALRRFATDRLPDDVAIAGRVELPKPFRPRETPYRRRVAELLDRWVPSGPPRAPMADDEAAPCESWADHLAAARAARRLERRIEAARRRLETSVTGLVPQLRRILGLLDSWGYVDGWSLTVRGERLRVIYNELDLLLAESIERGLLDGLDPPSLAALVSAFTFEPRSDTGDGLWPTPALHSRGSDLTALWERLAAAERGARLAETRPPEAGFAAAAYRWASGEELAELFDEEEGSVGDFVRNCRQLIDLLRQIRDAVDSMRGTAGEAIRALDRGVVAAAGAL